MAQILARDGLHLALSTVGCMERDPAPQRPKARGQDIPQRMVIAKGPNRVWHLDHTTVRIG